MGDPAAKSSSTIGAKISTSIFNSLEQEIKQLELKNQIKNDSINNINNLNNQVTNGNQTSTMEPLNIKKRVNSFENRLAQIGKLEKKIEMPIPNRSSTPDEKTSPTNLFKLNK